MKIWKKYLIVILIGLAYLHAGQQLFNYSPLLNPDNVQFFGMIFDLLHYSLVAIPAAFAIRLICYNIPNSGIVISFGLTWIVYSAYTLLSGAWLIGVANLLIYTMWLFSFLFVFQAFNKSLQPTAKSGG